MFVQVPPEPGPPLVTSPPVPSVPPTPTLLKRVAGPVPAIVAGWGAALVLAVTQEPGVALFATLGLAGAFVAGLVGVGGAIVMFPLLLYVPPLVGLPALSPHAVAGATMIQVAAAALTGVLGHVHYGRVRGAVVATVGGGMVVGAFAGALLSTLVAGATLTAVFASLALVAGALMFLPQRLQPPEVPVGALRVPRVLAVASGLGIGVFAGMVGAGGGFLLVPVMIFALRIPARDAVGASLGVVLMAGLAGAAGKIVTAQVEWPLALALVAGALPGAWVGAAVSRRVTTRGLSVILGVVIALVAATMWWEVLRR